MVAIPAVANLVGTGEDERIRRGFWRAMRLLVLATLPLVAGAAVVGPALLACSTAPSSRTPGRCCW